MIANGSMSLKGVVGLFPADRSKDGEDVDVFLSEADRESGNASAKF